MYYTLPMKDDALHEGKLLQKYLKDNKLNQDKEAIKLGYANRTALAYHFRKPKLDFEFKQELTKAGYKLFDASGNYIDAHKTNIAHEPATAYVSAGTHWREMYELSERHVALLEKQVHLQNEVIRMQEEKIDELRKN
jgi:hypothetical protein